MTKLLIWLFPSLYLRFFKSEAYQKLQFMKEYEKMMQRINKAVFIREKLKDMREDIRREYDKVNESLDAAQIALENANKQPEPDKTLKEALEKTIESKKKDVEQFKTQIDQLDKQISEPGGIEDTIASYRAILPLIERLIRQ